MRRKITYCLVFILGFLSLQAQQGLSLQLSILDSTNLSKKYKLPKSVKNEMEAKEELSDLIVQLRKEGFVTASIDSFQCDSSICQALLFIGKEYKLEKLYNGNLEEEVWEKLNLHKSSTKLNIASIPQIEKKILAYYENHAYPYAQVWLDEIELNGQNFQASVYVNKNEGITIDTLIVHGNTKTKSKFLARYLGVQVGDDYNQSKFNAVSQKLKQLSYLQESKPSELYFTPGKVSLHVFLEKQKSNQFNLVLGVLPNSNLDDKKITITGDGRLRLLNSFGVGEEIFAEFRQLKPRTQNLDVSFAYPYLLNSPIGTYGTFNLYKNDSLFIDINTEVGFLYQFGGFNHLKFYYKNQSSNILNADTVAIKSSGTLPSTLDFRSNNYGVALELQKLDYVLNPRSGYILMLSGGVGLNKIKVNQSIASLLDFQGEGFKINMTPSNLKR